MRNNLLVLAILPLLVGPTLANPPCRSCAVRAKARVIVKRQVVIKKVLDPVAIFVPTYVSTIAPFSVAAPLYAPPPPQPPAPVAMPAPVYPQARQQSYSYQASKYQAQQYQQPQQCPQQEPYQAPMPARQDQCLTNDRLATLLEQLCAEVRSMRAMPQNGNGYKNGNGDGPQEIPNPPARVPRNGNGVPRVFGKCTACHSNGAAEGGEYQMFDGGKLRGDFSERELRLMMQKIQLGTMPPQPNKHNVQSATDEEVTEFAEWMAKQE